MVKKKTICNQLLYFTPQIIFPLILCQHHALVIQYYKLTINEDDEGTKYNSWPPSPAANAAINNK